MLPQVAVGLDLPPRGRAGPSQVPGKAGPLHRESRLASGHFSQGLHSGTQFPGWQPMQVWLGTKVQSHPSRGPGSDPWL